MRNARNIIATAGDPGALTEAFSALPIVEEVTGLGPTKCSIRTYTGLQIDLRVVPDDTMRGLELRKGSADLTINDVSPDIAHQLQEDALTVTTAPGVDYAYIGLNMRDPVLADRRVRHQGRMER